MNRWLVAVALLVGGAASFSYADYVLIRAVLGGKREDPNNPTPTNPAGNPPGNPPGPGRPGPGRPGPGRPGPGGPGGPNPGDDVTIPQLGGGQSADIDTAALAVQAVVEVKKKVPQPGQAAINWNVTHRWSAPQGSTRLYNDDRTLLTRGLPIATPHSHWEARRQGAFKGDRKKVVELGEWALAHGLYDEFAALMDGLASSKEDKNASTPAELKDAIKAFGEVKASLEKPIEGENRANFWRTRLSARMETSKHYAVIYTSANANPPEVQSRLAALENHMRAFYYYFALRGVALPVPSDKLVAVLLAEPNEFRRQRAVVEDEPLVSDGFYAHRDHICVFSAQRLDTAYQVFSRQTAPLWSGGTYDRAKLLDGTEKRKVSQTTPDEYRRLMTLALLEKALEDEAERAAVSHEGTRQLLVAAGLVPRTIVMPQWAEFGSAAVFETPKGPYPLAPVQSQTAIFPGVAGPSWEYLRIFKQGLTAEEQGTQAEFLRKVVTDGYFNQIVSMVNRQGQLVPDHERLLGARTTAWALSYYLIKARLPGMLKYYQELSAMPRDLELDDKAVLACFARAFDVANATQDGVDPTKFEQLAKDWLAYVRNVPIPGVDLGLERELNTQPGAPGAGGPANPGASDNPGAPNRPGRPGPGAPGRP